jgi:hypothetical protein
VDDLPERTLRVNDGVGGAGFVAIPLQELGELTPQGFALHAALLSYGWRGSCWPGMDKLGARTRMGEKALRAAKDELIGAGLLDQTRRGQGKPNLYVVRTWDQRRAESAESRSSQAQVLDPPVGRHEVDVEEVDVVLSNERTTSDPSSEPFSEPSRPTSKTADSNGKTGSTGSCASTRDRALRLSQAGGVLKLCYRLAELMVENDPKAKPKPSSVGWMDAAEKLMRIDERHFEECMAVLEWSQRNEFWKANILSMPKFREKYPTLRAQWVRSRQPQQSAAAAPVSSAELAAAFERGEFARPPRSGL